MLATNNFKIINHQQGSQDWLAWRKEHITATDCAAIMGANPWKTRHELWLEKMGLIDPPKMNYNMRRGQELEPIARQKASELIGIDFQPIVLEHENGWMGASYDGVSDDMDVMLEIKCGRAAFTAAQANEIPAYYIFQLQHLIECLKPSKSLYYAYDDDTDTGILIDVNMSQEYIDVILEQEYAFYKSMINFEEPLII